MGRINVKLYMELFKSRKDCYAIQRRDGSYAPVDREFTEEIVRHHIDGEYTTGQYVVDPDGDAVKFACIDNDIETDNDDGIDAALDAAIEERRAAIDLGFDQNQCWIEFSGRRGYHMWVFFQEKVPAIHAKKVMEEVVADIEIEGGHTEVFPKQVALSDTGYGNLVKTPLGVHQKTGNRMLFVDDFGDAYDDQGAIIRAISRNRVGVSQLSSIVEDIGEDLDDLEEQVRERRERKESDVQIDGDIEMRPCMKEAMNGEQGELRGDAGHHMRLALAAEMLNSGMSIEEAQEAFSQFDNYDPQITLEKLREISREGHRPWKCSTIKEKCGEYAEDCPCPYQNPDAITSMELNRKMYGDQWSEDDDE